MHGVPSQLLSDCGGALLSKLLQEIGKLLGFHKANATMYQCKPIVQLKDLTTSIDMLTKTAELAKWQELG